MKSPVVVRVTTHRSLPARMPLFAASTFLILVSAACGENVPKDGRVSPGTAAEYFLLRSDKALNGGNPAEALQLARRALREDSASAVGAFMVGEALQALSRPTEAAAAYRRVLRLDPKFPNAQMRLGNLAYEAGEVDVALERYRQELEVQRTSVVLYNTGLAYLAMGESDSARTALHEALRLDPGHALSHMALSELSELDGDFERAAAHAREAVRLQPDDPTVTKHLGLLYLRNARNDSAAALLEAVIRKDMLDAEAHYALGQAYQRMGLPEAAARAFGRHERAKRTLDVVKELRKQLDADPENLSVIRQLAHLLLVGGRYDEAATYLRAILTEQPADLLARTELATLLAAKGDAAGAEREYRNVLERDPDRARVWMYLGTLLLRNGRNEEGQQALDRATQLDPGLRARVDSLRHVG